MAKKLMCWLGRHSWMTRVEGGESYKVCSECGKMPRRGVADTRQQHHSGDWATNPEAVGRDTGDWVAYTVRSDSKRNGVHVVNADGTVHQQLVSADARQPLWRPAPKTRR